MLVPFFSPRFLFKGAQFFKDFHCWSINFEQIHLYRFILSIVMPIKSLQQKFPKCAQQCVKPLKDSWNIVGYCFAVRGHLCHELNQFPFQLKFPNFVIIFDCPSFIKEVLSGIKIIFIMFKTGYFVNLRDLTWSQVLKNIWTVHFSKYI